MNTVNTIPTLREVQVKYQPQKNIPKIQDSRTLYELVKPIFEENLTICEHFKVLFLDKAMRVKGYKTISIGGIASTIVDRRLIMAYALKSLSSYIILVHNHPSGNLAPSAADIDITHTIKLAAHLMDIKVLDHLIIGEGGYYSFADEGKI